jgi:hypothetical protein
MAPRPRRGDVLAELREYPRQIGLRLPNYQFAVRLDDDRRGRTGNIMSLPFALASNPLVIRVASVDVVAEQRPRQ